jgi:hypothetical protein
MLSLALSLLDCTHSPAPCFCFCIVASCALSTDGIGDLVDVWRQLCVRAGIIVDSVVDAFIVHL